VIYNIYCSIYVQKSYKILTIPLRMGNKTQNSINKLIEQKLKMTKITKNKFEIDFNNPYIND
jgi:hypothetical protein